MDPKIGGPEHHADRLARGEFGSPSLNLAATDAPAPAKPSCEIATFREGEVCSKCGGPKLSVEFVPESSCRPGVTRTTPEHLLLRCRRCGFGFRRAPLNLAPGTVPEPWPLFDPAGERPSEHDLGALLAGETESVRLKNVFEREDLWTVGDLASLTEPEFLGRREVGTVALNDARKILRKRNLRFRRPGERVLRPRG